MAEKKHKRTALGFSLGAIAVAAVAGGYFLYGKGSANRRKKIKGWMLKAKGEVLEKIEGLKYISREDYHNIVDVVAAKYKKLKHVNAKEIHVLAKELKAHWKNVSKEAAKKVKRSRR